MDQVLPFPVVGMDRRSVSILAAGHFCIDLCQGAVPAFLPFLVLERHFSYTAAASLVLAISLASSVIQPVFGSLADRFAAPWFMPLGLLVAGLGLTGASLAPDFWQIALALMISGVGVATFHPEAARWMNLVAGDRRATAMSLFSLGGNLGFAVGPLLTTALVLWLGLPGADLLLVPLSAISLVLILTFPRFLSYHRRPPAEGKKVAESAGNNWRAFWFLTGTVMARSIVFYGVNTFLPLYWIGVLHQSKSISSLALTLLLLIGAVGTIASGRLADRYGRRIVVLVGFSALAPALLAFVTLGSLNVFLAFVLLLPIGLALFAPASVMVVMGQEYLPANIGVASGVTLGLAVSVGGITTPFYGHLADLYGVQASLIGLIVVPLLAVGITLALPRDRRSPVQLAQAVEDAPQCASFHRETPETLPVLQEKPQMAD